MPVGKFARFAVPIMLVVFWAAFFESHPLQALGI